MEEQRWYRQNDFLKRYGNLEQGYKFFGLSDSVERKTEGRCGRMEYFQRFIINEMIKINKYVRTAGKAESEEERKRRQPEAIAIC